MEQTSSAEALEILVVEDEYLIAMDLRDFLEAGGYLVVGPVSTVAAALAELDRRKPCACVLDVNLRGQHSVPVAHKLIEQKVPFVLSSAYEQETLDQHAVFRGVTNIGKPATEHRLLSALATLVHR
ncbi:response regulator [Devosia sp. RR2S18]|uniref:response regulator n=1 Tax=Devosia rhizosphaerae TaxID=3049774 RepID=UPI0025406B79|nr:response regulator [Devosia sp. RR2S18]WIJ26405.1 response regulator [Devosia sp. RR2S18]